MPISSVRLLDFADEPLAAEPLDPLDELDDDEFDEPQALTTRANTTANAIA